MKGHQYRERAPLWQIEDAMETFGRLVEAYGSVAAVARRLDVKPPAASKWKRGLANPSVEACMRIFELERQAARELANFERKRAV